MTVRDLIYLALTLALLIGGIYALGTGHFILSAIALPCTALPLSAIGLD